MSMDWGGTSRSFSRVHIWDPAQLVVCGVAVAVCLACVVARAWRTQGGKLLEGKQHLVDSISGPAAVDELEYHYDAYDAWLGAGTFMSVCFVISWAAGVLDATFFLSFFLLPFFLFYFLYFNYG